MSPRILVKSCVGGGWEESFSEHPDAVRIFVCGFFERIFRADFSVRIFVRILDSLRADFDADFLLRFFGREIAARATKKILQKSSPKSSPIPPRIFASQPSLGLEKSRMHTWVPVA